MSQREPGRRRICLVCFARLGKPGSLSLITVVFTGLPPAAAIRSVKSPRDSAAAAWPWDRRAFRDAPRVIGMMNNGQPLDSRHAPSQTARKAIQHGEFGGREAVGLDQHFRDLMAGVCAPVAIVTTADQEGVHGATVSSLASVSLRPPLVSIALDCNSALLARILDHGRFGVNVLGRAQDDLAVVFASRGVDRFHYVDWSMADGLPRLEGTVGWAACDLVQSVMAGDHQLLIGLVCRAASSQHAPLIYGHRTFGTHSRFQQRPRTPVADCIAACAR